MANQNKRQEDRNQQENNQGGFLNQVGETVENMVDTLTGDNQQGERNNQKNRS